MPTRTLFLFTLALGAAIFLTGARTSPPTPCVLNPDAGFVAQTVPLEPDIVGSGIDATQLLGKALEKISGPRTAGMNTKIRQTMTDADANFVAHGFLQRGPNHCARLEMDLGKQGRLQVVSD